MYVCPLRDSSNVKTIALNTIYDNKCTIIDIYCAKYLRVDGYFGRDLVMRGF